MAGERVNPAREFRQRSDSLIIFKNPRADAVRLANKDVEFWLRSCLLRLLVLKTRNKVL